MGKSAVYFFAEYPIEFAAWAGLANIIREVRPDLPLVLIYTSERNSAGYDWNFFLRLFDNVYKITGIWWPGNWRAGITGRNLSLALLKGFAKARQVASEMRAIPFQPNSLAFVLNGLSLNQMLFLKRVKQAAEVDSVLVTEQRDDLLLSDYTLNYSQSYYLNLYSHFFGTAYLDVYWMRTAKGRTGQREYRFRTKPADFFFNGIHASKRLSPKSGQVFFPFYMKERPPTQSHESVVLFDDAFEWEPSLAIDACYQRYNELIDMIKTKHQNARLIYKPHPGETAKQRAKRNLKGFEVIDSLSSEALIMSEPSISTTYSFASTSILTAACLGVRSYFLYPLFGDNCIPVTTMRRYEEYCNSEVYPQMCLRSVSDWLGDKNRYDPSQVQGRVRDVAIKLLETVGLVEPNQVPGLKPDLKVTPDERWSNGVHPWPIRRLGRIVM